eukprot:TRINITY_DN111609_c0_g1_i1.p1 TRINITY_DN111609_c0_g1~~TRINITY_DN111609_c0_g1_i1.p1  ORF type:complete len:657 (+),score=160.64 TRINITY_DN111609_c0_g1_i1:266-1972(+)
MTLLVDVMQNVGFEFIFFVATIGLALALRGMRRRSSQALKKLKASQKTAFGHGEATTPAAEVSQQTAAANSTEKRAAALNKRFNASPVPASTDEAREAAAAKMRARKKDAALTLAQAVEQTINGRLTTAKALSFYESLRPGGVHKNLQQELQAVSSRHSALEYFAALLQCAGRACRADAVEMILDDMPVAGLSPPLSLYESAMRLLAGKKFFREALAVYDRLDRAGFQPSPVSLSCLVGFAAELGDAERAVAFFDKLAKVDEPSIRACMTILRVHARKKDFAASIGVLDSMKQRGSRIDSLVLNLVLDTGVAAGVGLPELLALVESEPGASVADVVSHNIVLKAFAQRGEAAGAAQLLEAMRSRGVAPNLISYNTALDASVRGNHAEQAWRLFHELREQAGLQPDKCTCSVLVKAMASGRTAVTAARIESVLEVASQPRLLADCTQQLRGSLFSGLLEGACMPPVADAGLAMRVFALMREQQLVLGAQELRLLATTVALAGDADSCHMVWLFAAANCPGLERARGDLDRRTRAGVPVDVATLSVLKQVSEAEQPSRQTKRQWRPARQS